MSLFSATQSDASHKLAHSVEHLSKKQVVVGSNPTLKQYFVSLAWRLFYQCLKYAIGWKSQAFKVMPAAMQPPPTTRVKIFRCPGGGWLPWIIGQIVLHHAIGRKLQAYM